MSENESKSTETAKVGDLAKVKEGGTVMRPDGTQVSVTGGVYVLDVAGTFVVDGTETRVK